MAKNRNISWTEIIPHESLPSLRWFYSDLIPTLFEVASPFQHSEDERLVKDWQYPSWLEYYQNPPEGFFKLICLAVNAGEPNLNSDIAPKRRWVLDMIERLHDLAVSNERIETISLRITDFALPRLLPLKLTQFIILNHLACLFEYKKTLPSLIEAAQGGDVDAMLKLVTIDPTFLEMETIRNKVRLATLFNDTTFLKPLGRAVASSESVINLRKHGDDFFIWLTWHLGFESTGVEQFGHFLWEVGMKRYKSTASLQRKLNRLGLSTK